MITSLFAAFSFVFRLSNIGGYCVDVFDRPLSQVGSRRKRCPGQFGQDGMGSIPANLSTKHASCFPPSSMPASIEISIKLIVCLSVDVFGMLPFICV
jgi:hypothetical protein